jgi:hypothetical protein
MVNESIEIAHLFGIAIKNRIPDGYSQKKSKNTLQNRIYQARYRRKRRFIVMKQKNQDNVQNPCTSIDE